MTNSKDDQQPAGAEKQAGENLEHQDQVRDGRRYAVSNHRGKASGKVRYIEGNAPKQGCRFL